MLSWAVTGAVTLLAVGTANVRAGGHCSLLDAVLVRNSACRRRCERWAEPVHDLSYGAFNLA